MHVEIVDTCYTSLIVDTMSYVLFINNCNVSGLLDWVEFLSEVGGVNQRIIGSDSTFLLHPHTPNRGFSFHLTHLTSISYGQPKNFHSVPSPTHSLKLLLSFFTYHNSPSSQQALLVFLPISVHLKVSHYFQNRNQ
jgi:hypothetical protein